MAFSICYWANYTQGRTTLSRKSKNAVADDRVLKFLYDADLRSVLSPEIQEWSHKSRSRTNNLYLLTRPIISLQLCKKYLTAVNFKTRSYSRDVFRSQAAYKRLISTPFRSKCMASCL